MCIGVWRYSDFELGGRCIKRIRGGKVVDEYIVKFMSLFLDEGGKIFSLCIILKDSMLYMGFIFI